MKQELVKRIVKVGNSAGVLLPREWYGGEAKIELIKMPIDIEKDILVILKPYLKDIMGVYLAGSYARGEQRPDSDVDILVVTCNVNKRLKQGKYNIIMLSQEELEKSLKRNILPVLPMIIESKPIINDSLAEKYSLTKVNAKNLQRYLEITKSSMDICSKFIEECKEEIISDGLAYSLILHLRSAYIVDCLINRREWPTKGILFLIKNIAGSLKSYDGYLRVKNNLSLKSEVPVEEARRLLEYTLIKVEEHKKWAQKRK